MMEEELEDLGDLDGVGGRMVNSRRGGNSHSN